jgi:hypothetical protein
MRLSNVSIDPVQTFARPARAVRPMLVRRLHVDLMRIFASSYRRTGL